MRKSPRLKVLILGGTGQLGHKLWQSFAQRFETYLTVRQSFAAYAHLNLFDRARTLDHISALDFDSVVRAVGTTCPDVVVNCIGIVKQRREAEDPISSIAVNALFPHKLAALCTVAQARLVHISTDCVFSGRKGNYDETDVADAEDLYGRSKLLGEVKSENCVTLRTSMIGHELETTHGLLEWFLRQAGGTVPGYKRAVFSGLTTKALAHVIANVMTNYPQLQGLWHVASEPIDKFNLLSLIKQIYHINVNVVPDETINIDRSLNGQRFASQTGFTPPSWTSMIEDMHEESVHYLRVKCHHAH